MNTLLQDLRYAMRQLRMSPGFTATAVLTLAIGIGATTAIFTLVHAILLKSLPVTNPAQLYRIGDSQECCNDGWEDSDWGLFSYPLYQRLSAAAPEFEETAAFQAGPSTYGFRSETRDHEARPMRNEFVTGNYFHLFGLSAYAGRLLQASDDQRSATPVAVMSYTTWQQAYGSDPSSIGTAFIVDGHPVTLVGITPPGFYGETLRSTPPDFYIPVQQEMLLDGPDGKMQSNHQHWLYAIGRLKPGAKLDGVAARLTGVLQQWLRNEDDLPAEFKPQLEPTIPQKYIKLASAGSGVAIMQETYGTDLKLLLAVCGAVLLIACANIANLLLARGSARRGNTALRLALGATRQRLIVPAFDGGRAAVVVWRNIGPVTGALAARG